MKVYVVECFWYRDSEVNVFKTLEEAREYMKKDFEDIVKSYDYTIDNDIVKDDEGNDISDLTFINKDYARIDNEMLNIEDKMTWRIFEREL